MQCAYVSVMQIVTPPCLISSCTDSQPLATNQPPSISHHSDNPTTTIVDSSQTFDIDSQEFATTFRPCFSNRKTISLPLTKLGSLALGRGSVAVCGIVQYFKPVTRSRGSDFYITIGLLDETSATNTVSCTLFNQSDQRLISNIPVGQIVLLKGLKTSNYQGRIQATGYNGVIIGVFRNRQDEPVPKSIGDWYSLSNQEKDVIARLKTWSHEQGMLLVNTQLCKFSVGHFFNTVCRVAAVHTCMDENRTALKIFDGTTPKFPCDHLDTTQGRWTSDLDRQLAVKYSSVICEVQVTDWNRHFSIEPGQYISLRNVHVEPNCRDGPLGKNDIQAVTLTLSPKQNSGTITILIGNESERVNKYLRDFPEPCGPFPIFMRPSNTPPGPLFEIITNDRTKQTATVQEVLKSPPGKLFVVEGQIMSFSNGPIEELCQLRCSMCKTRYVFPRSSEPPLPEMVCVFCSNSKNDGPRVVYMYVFVMRLKDRTGILDICVTAEDGEIFLHHVSPTNLYARQSSREELTKLLYVLTGGNDPFYPVPTEMDFERPRVKCCVQTFTSIDGKARFTLNDTVCKVSSLMCDCV